MKRLLIFVLALTTLATAAEYKGVVFTGGTASVAPQAEGTLQWNADNITFVSGTSTLVLPYTAISTWDYQEHNRHRLGVLPTIAVGLIAARQKIRLLSINYTDESAKHQSAIFDVPAEMKDVIEPTLASRVGRRCYQQCNNQWRPSHTSTTVTAPANATSVTVNLANAQSGTATQPAANSQAQPK